MNECVFCKIVEGSIPASILARSPDAVAFRDLNPQAPTHILVIPTTHVTSAAQIGHGPEAARVFGEVLRLGVEVAVQEGLSEGGYRLVINTGEEGGQTVPHLHLHVLGGRQMRWPPG